MEVKEQKQKKKDQTEDEEDDDDVEKKMLGTVKLPNIVIHNSL